MVVLLHTIPVNTLAFGIGLVCLLVGTAGVWLEWAQTAHDRDRYRHALEYLESQMRQKGTW